MYKGIRFDYGNGEYKGTVKLATTVAFKKKLHFEKKWSFD